MKLKLKKAACIMCLLCFFAGILTACAGNNNDAFVEKADFNKCKLFVHNVTCNYIYEMRTVSDSDFEDEIIALATGVMPFRPVISADIILGEGSEGYFVFKNDKVSYTFGFFKVDEQLSIDYIYRDTPLITVDKANIDEFGQPHTEWAWYCSLSAADYANLYEAIQTYTGGEIVG